VQKNFPNCQYRYILSLVAADHTGSQWLSSFNDVAEKILGKSASVLAHMKETNPQQYEMVFNEAVFKQYTFKIRAKLENFNDEMRVKLGLLNVTPINFVSESRQLISMIRQYN